MAHVFQSLGELGDHLEGSGRTVPGAFVVDPPLTLMEAVESYSVWASQPSVRKVVDFIARNIASLTLHQYVRVSDTERRRLRGTPVSRMLAKPSTDPLATAYRFWHGVIVDWMIYDRWMALRVTDGGETKLQRVPGRRYRYEHDGLDRTTGARVADENGSTKFIPVDSGLYIGDAGYAVHGANGTSPMRTLKDILSESNEAVKFRRDVLARGARVPAYITRPKPWPADGKARTRFVEDWKAFEANGGRAGGTPLLEDGMELKAVEAFKPVDLAIMEGRTLTDIEVCSAYHIAPELVGARQGNYSTVDAFRQMLWGPSLGPYIVQWEQVVNLAVGSEDEYVEANVDAKLRGSFLEQAAVTSSAVGAPWMVRNEARAMRNLPPVPGGDELVTPLNVLVGGQASPRDSGSQNQTPKTGARHHRAYLGKPAKAAATDNQATAVERVVRAFFDRQGAAVLSALGADVDDWWDGDRWDSELAIDLQAVTHTLAATLGPLAAEALGYPDGYDPDLTVNYLAAVSEERARGINATTRDQVQAALDAGEDGDPAAVFKDDARPGAIAAAVATFAAGFATVEAAKQIRDEQGVEVTKTWITGPNPRPEHAEMDGETAPIDAPFSNGMQWPGQGGPEDAGCNCSVSIEV